MTAVGSAGARGTRATEDGEMATQIGKIYSCGGCGSQFIVTKAGSGDLTCCGKPMEQKK